MAAAPALQSMFSPLGKYRPFEVDEGSPAFPPGEGGPLAVDEGYVGNVYPHPGYADPRSLPLRSTDLRPREGSTILRWTRDGF